LLQANYTDVSVLMHILGDKHSAPQPLVFGGGDAFEWVQSVTSLTPAEGSEKDAAGHEALVRQLAPGIAAAVHEGMLGFLISVKNPYSWAASVCAYWHLIPTGLPRSTRRPLPFLPRPAARVLRWAEERRACWHLHRACTRFNELHREWLRHHETFAPRSTIVRYEGLLADPTRVLGEIARKHNLIPNGHPISAIREAVLPADWDDKRSPSGSVLFDENYYRESRYMESLTPVMCEVVSKTIDWGLMRDLGYQPHEALSHQAEPAERRLQPGLATPQDSPRRPPLPS
jgi:hypothetical protein